MTHSAASLRYRLSLEETAAGTGFFAPVPQNPTTFSDGVRYLQQHPNDAFMHHYLLGCIAAMDLDAVQELLRSETGDDPIIRALLLEAALIYDHLPGLRNQFKRREIKILADATPLVDLRSEILPDQALHRQWAALFRANLTCHRPLPPPEKTGLAFPVDGVDGNEPPLPEGAHLQAIIEASKPDSQFPGRTRPPLQETIDRALTALEALDLFEGGELRHQSSLSPIALMRKWRFSHQVNSGELAYTLSGVQTSYGRGLSLEAARASCLMEVVERCSSFAGVAESGITGTLRPHPLLHGRRSRLAAEGYPLLDPNSLCLEVPYRDEALYWMEGERVTLDGFSPVWVPVQCVYLFCNLDERALFSGLGSTGLASGNIIAEARLSALYELIERDSEAVNPFHPSRCFRVYAEDERIGALVEDYRARGIHLQFQDISPAFGIPCCSCFVTHRDGTVVRGSGANLNGRQAVLSALTETPYPYPMGPPSAPALPDLPWLQFESLPDVSTGSPEKDSVRVEKTLSANGFEPIYVDLTRKDLKIPVVRALVPGLEIIADFDRTSRINPRLFNNYLKIHYKNDS
ncbi:YcaO-like family protein [uncultured Desulfosarcina sp.]|uniref:YcaO-like family protein n=1 Tax=uncultured Desulfosarcina sp. TaxID=218289 RepID=UPI0029C749FA|nr:YcaO-like family protein [uncultured Desulfosarcina sp.]